jgi:DNA-binding response OmpR family regulator
MVTELMRLMILYEHSQILDLISTLSILDINMPKMNGYELYKELRRIDNKVNVCFLTGSEVYDDRLRMSPPEILNYAKSFSKPLALDDLVKKIKKK